MPRSRGLISSCSSSVPVGRVPGLRARIGLRGSVQQAARPGGPQRGFRVGRPARASRPELDLFRPTDDFAAAFDPTPRRHRPGPGLGPSSHPAARPGAGVDWNERNDSFLLRGVDLQSAARWLADARADKQPTPVPLQVEYVQASQEWEGREIDRLNRLLDEAREQRRIAEAERRNAQVQLAESLIAQGDMLGQLHRWPDARALYLRARLQLRELRISVAAGRRLPLEHGPARPPGSPGHQRAPRRCPGRHVRP